MGNYLGYLLTSCMGSGVSSDSSGSAEGTGTQWWVIVIYIVVFIVFIYFIMVRPQRKQKQKQADTMSQMEPGDSVLTTSGFYGTVVSVTGDTVIVEFGNNKNCRIPMAKQAISQVEKANAAAGGAASAPQSRKKFFDRATKNDGAADEAAQIVDKASEAPADTVISADAQDVQADTAGEASEAPAEEVNAPAEEKKAPEPTSVTDVAKSTFKKFFK